MLFDLTSDPGSFQEWMNSLFKPLLRRCVLVYFNDILIYSNSPEDHLQHLTAVFDQMREHSIFFKVSNILL